MTPQTIPISINDLASLAVEHWRLSRTLQPILDHPPLGPVRHSLRKIQDLLKNAQIEVQTFDGIPYDPGLNARVLERTLMPHLPQNSTIVSETVSPLVLHQNQVIKPAEIVIAHNT